MRFVLPFSIAAVATACLVALPRSHGEPLIVQGSPPAPTEAATKIYVEVPSVSLGVLSWMATNIVHAVITSQTSVQPATGYDYTAMGIQVIEQVKGNTPLGALVCVGGNFALGGETRLVGAPEFAVGDEVILFLVQSPGTSLYGILGLSAGTFRILRPQGTTDAWVVGDDMVSTAIEPFIEKVVELSTIEPSPLGS